MLSLRVKPDAEESLVGFLSRLAERNGVPIDGIQWFARSIGLPFTSIGVLSTKRTDLTDITRNAGIAQAQLEQMAFWPEQSGLIRIGGGLVRRHDIGMAYRKVCPKCLASTGIHRRAWHLKAVNVCIIHQIPLASQCPRCRLTLRWNNSSVTRCGCGQDLRRMSVPEIPELSVSGTEAVLAALGIEAINRGLPLQLPNQFLHLHASDLISLMLHLGWFSEQGGVFPRSAFSERSRHQIPAALNAGAALLPKWPGSAHRLLDTMARGGSARPGRFGLRRELGPIANWIAELDESAPLKCLVMQVIVEWATTRVHMPMRAKSLGRHNERIEQMTISEGARQLSLRASRLRDFAKANDLIVYAPEKAGPGAPLLTARSMVERLREERDDLINQRDSARLLGCGRTTFRWLADGGVLPPATSPASKLVSKPVWSRIALEGFVDALRGLVSPSLKQSRKPRLSLVRALMLLGRRGWSARDVIQSLTEGRWGPPVALSDKTNLADLVAPPAMIAATKMEMEPNLLTVVEVAHALGVKQEVAYAMTRLGIIRTNSGHGYLGPGRLISQSELHRFETDYFLPSRLDYHLKRRRGQSAQELIALGLKPVMGPSTDGSRQYLFERAAVTEVQQIAEWKSLP